MKSLRQNDKTLVRGKKSWIGAIALGLTVSLVSACNQSAPDTQAEQENVTSGEVAQVEAGDPVVGELVTVRSGIVETIDDNSFVMESINGDPILIINPTGPAFTPPEENIPIQVTGQLEVFDTASIDQYGVDNLDPALYEEYDQQPAIVAQSIALAPRPQDLWDAPNTYFDETIAIEGDLRPLEGSENAFALFEEGWNDDIGVLVVGVNQAVDTASLEEGENIVVTGQARLADATLLQEADFGWDDNQIQEFLSRYENRPVIIVDEVYPSAVPPHPSV
ncbi:hypothetical protein IQ273_17160 [Nodosilinea sp. LEGE 07298]|uniref:hypothetical protein n=1 Tax=Nodosilinea sp. LEGE 07298 TaxID=2777970 RepID=UPI0018815D13|nr:hypothetical protein [Nodosilinea sp. LEGE 07298]MBE9111137.1 hypothetical protein [Nodosilinea sp. LEGE 07298]